MRVMVSFRPDLLRRLDKKAQAIGAARSHVLAAALARHLDDAEVAESARAQSVEAVSGVRRMKVRPITKGPDMAPAKVIQAGEKLLAQLQRLGVQVQEGLRRDYGNFDLEESELCHNADRYRDRVLSRCNEAREGWLSLAQTTLLSLAANPPPSPNRDPKARYFALHQLVALPLPDRIDRVAQAVKESDRLVYDVAMEAPAYLDLLPPSDIELLKRRWAERHSIHPKSGYVELAGVLERVTAIIHRLERSVIPQAA